MRDLSLQLTGKSVFRQVDLPGQGGQLEWPWGDPTPGPPLPGVVGQLVRLSSAWFSKLQLFPLIVSWEICHKRAPSTPL